MMEFQDLRKFRLRVSPIHELQIYEFGDPLGIPVLYLHGGPGAGVTQTSYTLFDPKVHRVVLFDQRGCGNSTPYASLEMNTTDELIGDIEKIRSYLNIGQWNIVGGSWGATLGLAYATRLSKNVIGGVFWGVTEFTSAEINLMCNVFPTYFPERWQNYINAGGSNDPLKIIDFEYNELNSLNRERIYNSVSRSVILWSCGISLNENFLLPEKTAFANLRLFFHYCIHNAFFTTENLPSSKGKNLDGFPIKFYHGRQDMRCFGSSSYRVHKSISGSQLTFIGSAAHGTLDEPLGDAIKQAVLLLGRTVS